MLRYVNECIKGAQMGIKVLDCTLRDGAYVVNSFFGDERIKNIIKNLCLSGVDIVECGWLRDFKHWDDSVFYSQPEDCKKYLSDGAKYALMFDLGRYDIDKLPQNSGVVDIIRIAFYKKSLREVEEAVKKVQKKGYEVFLQPSNVLEYEESDLMRLFEIANSCSVNAIYIVDSFGSMFPEDLERLIALFDRYVNPGIEIGFHSHNSIQLSFALSIDFINKMNRDIIVDSSLLGIGRGAGNTKTELLISYLNRHGKDYNTDSVWRVISEEIEPLAKESGWEYSAEKALKGLKGLHPNS